jgi:tRNA threonylcarbamoyladenosine biosynthesis protein TsaB
MRRLVIETATPCCSVALFDETGLVAKDHRRVGRGHAECLLPMIAALPDGGKSDTILVGCGPGSFTGVRVGIAAAKALGLGWGVPVHGFSTLALIAASALEQDNTAETIGVAIVGGHGEVFVQAFHARPLVPITDLASLPPEKAAQLLPEIVVGDAAEALVALRGSGKAYPAEPDASRSTFLPPKLTNLSAAPIYGRGPDARPMA